MKMTQFKVINRVSRKELIFNSEQLREFFRYRNDVCFMRVGKRPNEWRDYAVSVIKPKADTIVYSLALSLLSVGLVILITKLIMLCI